MQAVRVENLQAFLLLKHQQHKHRTLSTIVQLTILLCHSSIINMATSSNMVLLGANPSRRGESQAIPSRGF